MIKILITGFKHSGTTLLMQLIKAHPQVGCIDNEEGLIEFDKPKEWVLMFAEKTAGDLKKYAWGEKLPWGNRSNDVKAERPIGIIKKWSKYFKGQSRILHIVRHPFDVVLSGLHGNKIVESDLSFVLATVPLVIDFTNPRKRCATIVYEDLVTEPEKYLRRIFTFLNLDVTDKIINNIINTPSLKFEEINADRAYAYKKKGIDREVDYDKILDSIEGRL